MKSNGKKCRPRERKQNSIGGMKMQSDNESKPGKPTVLQLLTKKEAALRLACSSRMIERLVGSGKLTTVKIRGAVRFRLSDIEQIIVKGTA
jgi:excisionase family DNA binding protein